MITVSKARKILGKSGEGMSEEQIELLLSQCKAMAEIMLEHFGFIKNPELENENQKSSPC